MSITRKELLNFLTEIADLGIEVGKALVETKTCSCKNCQEHNCQPYNRYVEYLNELQNEMTKTTKRLSEELAITS